MLIELPERVALQPLRAVIKDRERRDPRQPGLHVSQIIDDIAVSMKWLKEDEGRRLGAEEVFWEFGQAWEDTYARGLALTVGGEKPSPYQLDGVWCSPDWRRTFGAVDEIKSAWISSRTGSAHPKFRKYEYQLQAYMWGQQSEVGYLHVGYVKGNWADKLVDCKTFKLQRTESQLRKHWRGLLRHAEDRGWLNTA